MKKNPSVVAIDFDDTIGFIGTEDKDSVYVTKTVENLPNPRIVNLIKHLRKNKVKVIVYSSRWWGDFNAISVWLKKHKIKVDDIVLGRLKADAYICDRSVNTFASDVEIKTFSFLEDAKRKNGIS